MSEALRRTTLAPLPGCQQCAAMPFTLPKPQSDLARD
jgi:hypothetical protein